MNIPVLSPLAFRLLSACSGQGQTLDELRARLTHRRFPLDMEPPALHQHLASLAALDLLSMAGQDEARTYALMPAGEGCLAHMWDGGEAPDPTAAILAALILEPDLTVSGLSKRLSRRLGLPREGIRQILVAEEEAGHVTSRLCELQPGDTGQARRYRVVGER